MLVPAAAAGVNRSRGLEPSYHHQHGGRCLPRLPLPRTYPPRPPTSCASPQQQLIQQPSRGAQSYGGMKKFKAPASCWFDVAIATTDTRSASLTGGPDQCRATGGPADDESPESGARRCGIRGRGVCWPIMTLLHTAYGAFLANPSTTMVTDLYRALQLVQIPESLTDHTA